MVPGHPRVGGEHAHFAPADDPTVGSSPPTRGTLRRLLPAQQPKRVIPAWAGNTKAGATIRRIWSGHPRVGGEYRVEPDRRPEAHRVIGAGSAIVTTGDGIGLRSGGFGPRCPPAPSRSRGMPLHGSSPVRRF